MTMIRACRRLFLAIAQSAALVSSVVAQTYGTADGGCERAVAIRSTTPTHISTAPISQARDGYANSPRPPAMHTSACALMKATPARCG